jgi:hypothetical protein
MCWFSFLSKVPKGYMALEQFFVSARTIKRHHHYEATPIKAFMGKTAGSQFSTWYNVVKGRHMNVAFTTLLSWKEFALARMLRIFGKPRMCVFITTVLITKLFACVGGGNNRGHVLQESTSRSLCGPVCPSRTSERGGEGHCVKGGGGEEGKRERERAREVRVHYSLGYSG